MVPLLRVRLPQPLVPEGLGQGVGLGEARVDGQEARGTGEGGGGLSALMQAGGKRAGIWADDLLAGGLVRAADFFQDEAMLVLRSNWKK